jgi:RNA polymerase sigma factor (sigma-70 family)
MSASGPGYDGPDEQESLEELFGTVFGLAGEIASRISQDQVEARLRRTLQAVGRRQEEEEAARQAARRDPEGAWPGTGPPPAALVSQAAAGDRDAWDEIVERYAPLIWSICRRHGLGSADAADVAQAVWLHLMDQLDHLRDPGALPGWLAATTIRECCRRLAGRGAEGLDTRLAGSPRFVAGVVIDEEILAGRQMALRAAFAGLPPDCQQLLSMLTSDPPHSYAEISAELGIPVGSIGPYRARCLDRLRRHPVIAEDAVGFAPGPGQDQPATGPSAATRPAWTDPARLDTAGAHRGPTPLTPREHQIVTLIARGLSNREIADELVISPRTAARHEATILAKLGFGSRTQVASWATRHGTPR